MDTSLLSRPDLPISYLPIRAHRSRFAQLCWFVECIVQWLSDNVTTFPIQFWLHNILIIAYFLLDSTLFCLCHINKCPLYWSKEKPNLNPQNPPGEPVECSLNDDFTNIVVLQTISSEDQSVFIDSLEESYVNEFLFQEYNPITGNGLNGRVSVIDAVSGVITNVTDGQWQNTRMGKRVVPRLRESHLLTPSGRGVRVHTI